MSAGQVFVRTVNESLSLSSGLGGLKDQFWSTLIGAIVGAVFGGIISFFVQRYNIEQARADRHATAEEERSARLAAKREIEIALAWTVMHKITKMMSAIVSMKADIDAAMKRISEDTPQLWMTLCPMVPVFPPIAFTHDETAFLFATKDTRFQIAALEMADVHNNLMGLIDLYNKKREELTGAFEVEEVSGSLTSSVMDRETALRSAPLRIQLESLAASIARRAHSDAGEATALFDHFKSYCEGRFGRDFVVLERCEVPNQAAETA